MVAKIIDGKQISKEILENVKKEVEAFEKKPTLAVILVGSNPASQIYVKNKEKTARATGFNSIVKIMPDNTTKEELLSVIEEMNKNPEINAILLQLPLPKHLFEKDFLDKINPKKDVDGFNSINLGKLFKGENPYAVPCTPKGIMTVLEKFNVEIEGKTALVIGRSNIVGKPVSALLLKKNATVIQAHSRTKNLKELAKMADIIISATGHADIVKKDMIKEGAVVIDVGIIRGNDGKLRGDVEFDTVKENASLITPVPGGIGPMTISSLMQNTVELYKIQKV